jgi:alpha-D-ribose 1-methylphosphonate 5-triphosphate diphosphatase
MALLHPSCPLQTRPFDHDPDFPVVDMDSPGLAAKMETRAKRSGMETANFIALMREIWQRRPEVPAVIAQAGVKAGAAGAPMLSHDDSQPETRDFYRGHGAKISEFPMNPTVTLAAREAGDWIVFGAPNAARGGSHLGSPGAADMVTEGLCDILASDYYYPAMLAAVARLQADGIGSLPDLWKLVAANPAAALGLDDRGDIAVGRRADLVLLDWPEGRTPVVCQCIVGGRAAYGAIALG